MHRPTRVPRFSGAGDADGTGGEPLRCGLPHEPIHLRRQLPEVLHLRGLRDRGERAGLIAHDVEPVFLPGDAGVAIAGAERRGRARLRLEDRPQQPLDRPRDPGPLLRRRRRSRLRLRLRERRSGEGAAVGEVGHGEGAGGDGGAELALEGLELEGVVEGAPAVPHRGARPVEALLLGRFQRFLHLP